MSQLSSAEYSFSFTAPANGSSLRYYFLVDDIKPTHSQTLPTNAPSSYYTVNVRDMSGPIISWSILDGDFLSQGQTLSVTITDNTGVSINTLTFSIDGHSITYPDQALTWSTENATLVIDFSKISTTLSSQSTLTLSVSDTLSNTSTSSRSVKSTSSLILKGNDSDTVVNSPNPFNPNKTSTKFCFQLSQNAATTIYIYSMNHQLVKKIEGTLYAGYNDSLTWDGSDEAGNKVPNGVYLAFIKAEYKGQSTSKKLKIAVLR
jgi:flagellar hook assembly protein FlgD